MKRSLLTVMIFILTFGQDFTKLDKIVTSSLEKYNIKGIAIVAVKDNKAIYKKGFGIANEESKMSNDTRLYIASITKSFVGLAMNNLALDNKIDLNASLSKYLDKSYFPDSINIARIKVQDLLTHSHGLSNDAITVRTAFTGEYPKNLSKMLKFTSYHKGTWSQKFRYSNFSFVMAGIIIENITGMTWKAYLKKEILTPAEMLSSGTDFDFDPKLEAFPYYTHSDQPINTRKSESTMHAAGGLYTTLNDMENWLTLYTDKNQKRLPKKLMANLFDVRSDPKANAGPISMDQYSSGWVIGKVMGHNINFHFGGYGGYHTMVSYKASTGEGIFVFVNEQVGGQRIAAMLTTYFYMLMAKDENADKKIAMFNRVIDPVYTKKPKELVKFKYNQIEAMTGLYESEMYGRLSVDHNPDGFILTMGKLKGFAFKAENENEFMVQWAIGNTDKFKIEIENGELVLNFADANHFRKL